MTVLIKTLDQNIINDVQAYYKRQKSKNQSLDKEIDFRYMRGKTFYAWKNFLYKDILL